MKATKLLGVLLGLIAMLSAAGLSVLARHDGDDDPKAGKAMPTKGIAVLIVLGLKDTEATGWAGELKLSEGTVSGLRVAGSADPAEGAKWKGKSQVAKKKKKAGITPLQIQATLDAPPTATVTVSTRNGEFAFVLGELPANGGKLFLDDQARVKRGPLSVAIVTDPTDDDFPAAAVAPDGTVWVAYVAYKHGNPIDLPKDGSMPKDWSSLVTKGNGDQVKLVKFDDTKWSAPMDVSEPGLDVWRPSVAVHSNGWVTIAWSQDVGANWDLHYKTFDPTKNQWSRVERRGNPGPGINPVLVAGADHRFVTAFWQSWNGSSYDIVFDRLAARLNEGSSSAGMSDPFVVAASPANEWSPSAARDSKGNVYVAYDTYENGNYDVHLWKLGPGSKPIVVAGSPRFEARASVTVDKQDRVWVAYEEADANWGKDFGSKWTGKSGVPFYLTRQIQVRVVTGETVEQPKGEIPSAATDTLYGGGQRVRLSMPRLGCDGDGRVWLLYRRHPLATGQGEVWNSFATYHSGEKWSPAFQIPNSENFIDNRPAIARLQNGSLAAIYSTDKRAATTQSGKDNDLNVCVLAANGAAQESELAAVPPPPDGEKDDPVHANEAQDIQRMREFRLKVGGRTYRLLRGEFHRHTEMTSHRDQDGPFEEIWRYGLDVARMDWIGQGDHDNGQREYTWWLSQKQDDMYFHAPTFMPMYTYERSVAYPSGHRNVMFARRGIRPLPRMGGGEENQFGTKEEGSPDVKRLFAYLKHFGGICSSHTSATSMGTDWRDNDSEVEPVVEIYQGHRQNYEYEGAPQSASAGDTIGRYEPAGFVWNAWRKGYRLGIQVSSDHVSTHLSYGVVLAEKPTREGVVDAFKKRHSYGAQDNIILIVRSGEHLMGDEFTVKSHPEFEIQAIGTAPIARVSIIRGVGSEMPTYVYNTEPGKVEVNLIWRDEMAVAGETSYYYVRIEQADKKLAWASPMWIKYESKQRSSFDQRTRP